MTTVVGTDLADLILPNITFGDRLLAFDGIDNVSGGAGDDTIASSDGTDRIDSDAGDDLIFGNRGSDTLTGGDGSDIVYAGRDDDLAFGQSGDDILYGELGNDTIAGGSGDDSLYGGTGNDSILGDRGRDLLSGGSGDDWLDGGGDRDILTGGGGNDMFRLGRNFDGSSSGGATLTDADRITDFTRGPDRLLLTSAQRFDELTFAAIGNDTIVRDRISGDFLAIVEGVTDLDVTDFITSTASAGDAGSISLSSRAYSGREAAAGAALPARVTVSATRSGGSSGAVSALYSTAAGVQNTAAPGSDYTEVRNGVIVWADGETGTKTFDLLLPPDGATNIVETGETFSVLLERATNGAVLGFEQGAVVSIVDSAA